MTGQCTYDFDGESAIVTGPTKGIGRGIAERLAEAGADVVVNSRTESDVEAVAEELDATASGRVVGIPADVGETGDIESLVAGAIDAFGGIDCLVNNAAMWPREESMVEADLADWERTMNVNVRSQYYAAKLVAEHMIEQDIEGSIVNVSSQTGDRRCGGRGFYGVSNTAINGLTWRMAHDLAPHGIRMNAVSTDLTRSHQTEKEARMRADDRSPDELLAEWASERPLGRLGEPADLGDAVCFLASDRASYVVGEILRVSGGGNLQ